MIDRSIGPYRIGSPQVLFEDDSFFRFDVLPDGEGFITLRQVPGSGIITGLHVVVNWFEELRQLMEGR